MLALVLALLLASSTVFATGLTPKIQVLVDKGIVEGKAVDGNKDKIDFALDDQLTRAEITKLIVYLLGLEEEAKKAEADELKFADVKATHWARGPINVATSEKYSFIKGYTDGTFKAEEKVNFGELATMLVRLVKKVLTAEMEKEAKWPEAYMTWAEELGIFKDIKIENAWAKADRKTVFEMLYNGLFSDVKLPEVKEEKPVAEKVEFPKGLPSEVNGKKILARYKVTIKNDPDNLESYGEPGNPYLPIKVESEFDTGEGLKNHVFKGLADGRKAMFPAEIYQIAGLYLLAENNHAEMITYDAEFSDGRIVPIYFSFSNDEKYAIFEIDNIEEVLSRNEPVNIYFSSY